MSVPQTRNKQGVFLTGFAEMLELLQTIQSPKVRDRIIKGGFGSGLNILKTAIRKEAPKGKFGGLKEAIGRQIKKGGGPGVWFAKVGVNVGKKIKRAPHAHLVILGTDEERFREKIGGKFKYLNATAQQAENKHMLSTGQMPSNDFVKRGYEKRIGKAISALNRRVEKKLASELAKIAKQSSKK